MPDLPLHRLNQFIALKGPDAQAFEHLAVERRSFQRHDLIRAQGEPVDDVYFLADGWVACCVDSATGNRQIVKVHLPGDILGGASLALRQAAESLVALTKVEVHVIPAIRVGELFNTTPRLAAAMFLSAQQERIWLMDRLMSMGRTSAVQRLAAFLLSIHDRLSLLDPAAAGHFQLPLTQEEIASVLGITGVHANRSLARLDETGFVKRSGRWITLADVAALRRFSCMPQREFDRTPPWLGAVQKPEGSANG